MSSHPDRIVWNETGTTQIVWTREDNTVHTIGTVIDRSVLTAASAALAWADQHRVAHPVSEDDARVVASAYAESFDEHMANATEILPEHDRPRTDPGLVAAAAMNGQHSPFARPHS